MAAWSSRNRVLSGLFSQDAWAFPRRVNQSRFKNSLTLLLETQLPFLSAVIAD